MTTVRLAFGLLSAPTRWRWAALAPLSVAAAVVEMVAMAALYALIRILGDPSAATTLPVVGTLLAPIRPMGDRATLVVFTVLLVVVHAAKSGLQMLVAVRLAARSAAARTEIVRRLLAYYLARPYPFHLRRNSAELIRNVTTAVDVVVASVLNSAVGCATELAVVAGISAVLLATAPSVTVALVALLATTAGVVLRVTRTRAARWGAAQHRLQHELLATVQETLGAVKEITLLGRERFFFDEIVRRHEGLADVRRKTEILGAVPRVSVEASFIGAALLLVFVSAALGETGSQLLPLLGLYAYAGFRVIPSANRLLLYVGLIRGAAAPVATLAADLADDTTRPPAGDATAPAAAFRDAIVLDGVSFTHEGAARPTLVDARLTIRHGETIGIVGTTGAGKSTLVDLLVGLLDPTAGRILVDGRDLREVRRAWQRVIGYVPQGVVLVDETLRRNVALGLPDDRIDDERLRAAVRVAQLEDDVAILPEGLATMVGERGARLSGGQRQRVGIARALYHEPAVLVLDEATAALDAKTEAELLRAVRALPGTRTLVVVAHRMTSVRGCDRLLWLVDGQIAASGPYDELLRDHPGFQRLATARPDGDASTD